MAHSIKLKNRTIIEYINNRVKYDTKLKRFETQEECLIRLLKIKKGKTNND